MKSLDAFWADLKDLLNDYDMMGAVVVVQGSDKATATLVWPGCPRSCDEPEKCTSESLMRVSERLKQQAQQIEGMRKQTILN